MFAKKAHSLSTVTPPYYIISIMGNLIIDNSHNYDYNLIDTFCLRGIYEKKMLFFDLCFDSLVDMYRYGLSP